MTTALGFLAWGFVWVLGCVAFDLVLELRGPWLMLGGAATYAVCDTVANAIKSMGEA